MSAVTAVAEDVLGTQMVDVQMVAKKLDVSVVTVRRWEKQERFPAGLKLNGAKRWRLSDVESWIVDQAGAQ